MAEGGVVKAIPKDKYNLRACLGCSLIKAYDQFLADGCDNCDEILKLKGKKSHVLARTSMNYQGMIGMMAPTESWVARWQRIQTKIPGMYAISVTGELPPDLVRQLKAKGEYYNRDRRQV